MDTKGHEDRWTSMGATTLWDVAPRERLFQSLVLLEGALAGIPGRSPADADLRIFRTAGPPSPVKILCILCIDVNKPLTPA